LNKYTVKNLLLALATSTLLLAGCCAMYHTSQQWEYRAAMPPGGAHPVSIEARQQFLNELGKDGWVLVAADGDLFYLKRPKR